MFRRDDDYQRTDFLGYVAGLFRTEGDYSERAHAWLESNDRYGWSPPLWDANPFPKLRVWP